jgi:DNA-binding CsgD family transcriptional regulator
MVGLIGRVAERATIAGCLRAAMDGRRQLVLLAGEPGAGKTRLAGDALDQARELGLAVAIGRASEDEGSPPYWPFLQVFRGLDLTGPPELAAGGDGQAQDRFRMFEAAADTLAAAAAPNGLLVVLDDLQWADAATVALLVHLGSAVAPARLVLLATYRDTEVSDPLSAALATLARQGSTSRVRLTGLDPEEVGRCVAEVTGSPVPDPVAVAVHRRTSGNPFFVRELGRVLASSVDGRLPDGIRDAVRDRLDRLTPACRAAVCAAAVLGSDVDTVAVAHATGVAVPGMLDAVDEATTAGILVELTGRRFAHDLIREAARLEVPTAQRQQLHARLAEHLATRGDADDRAAEIAHHSLESLPIGDADLAVAWTERAAGRALAQLAWEEAVLLYQRALNAGAAHAVTPPNHRCRLLLAQATAQMRGFDVGSARISLAAAVDIARTEHDADALAQAALAMEGVNDTAWDPTARALAEEALALLPTVDSPVRVRLLALLAGARNWVVEDDLADRRADEALAIAERVGDRRALREALRAKQMARSGPDGAADRLALGDRLVALGTGAESIRVGVDGRSASSRVGSDDDDVLWGRLWRFDALAQLGDLDGCEAEAEHIRVVAARLRSPLAGWHAARCRAAVDAARGRFDRALAHIDDSQALAIRAGTPSGRAIWWMVRVQLGELTSNPRELEELPRFEGPVASFVRSIQVNWLLARGERDEAQRVYRSVLPVLDELPRFVTVSAYAGMIDLAAEFDDRATAAQLYQRLLPHADLWVCSGAGAPMILGTIRYPLGVAAATVGRLDDAIRHLRAAVASGEASGMPPMVAQASYQLARVLARGRRPGDRDEAAALATRAAAMAGRMGMRPVADGARELSGSLAGRTADALTRREREIATLLAQGLSNRQIAAANHISERTVESHVQHILDKLGLANRTQVATWTAENIRTDPP